jgi:type II secretory pathway component PulK
MPFGAEMQTAHWSDERGIALAVALFALAVMGAIVGGNFFAGQLEQQSGRNTLFAHQAAEAAEAGLSDATASLPAATLEALPLGGEPLDLGTITLEGRVSVSRQVWRLTAKVFLIRARGIRTDAAGAPLAARSLGSLVQLVSTDVTVLERGWVQLY